MSRIARPTRARSAASLIVGTVLATALASGAPHAHAATPTTDLETTALRISGTAIPAGGVIPAGRTLTPVRLTTSDPATTANDALILSGAVPEVRSRKPRFVIPAVPAEQATLGIDGVTVATTVPDFRAVSLQTDRGPVLAVVFTVGGVSYALPRSDQPNGATGTVASSTVNTVTVSNLFALQYGLRPIGAQPRVGSMFQENMFGATTLSSQTVRRTVLDADAIRGNGDSPGDELVLADNGAPIWTPAAEVLATVTLRNGAFVAVRGLRYEEFGPYGQATTTWAFDRAALAAVGATVSDVTDVVSSAATDHDLSWQDLGFDLL